MKITTTKALPTPTELADILKKEFSAEYSYKLFGLGKKSIIVGKSAFIGAQVSVSGNEISVQATPPSVFAGLLSALSLTELALVFVPVFYLGGGSIAQYRGL